MPCFIDTDNCTLLVHQGRVIVLTPQPRRALDTAQPRVLEPSSRHRAAMIVSSCSSGTSLYFISLRFRSTLFSAILTRSMLDLMLASRGPNCPLSFFSQPTTPCIAVVTPCVSSEVVSVSTREPPTLS